MSELKWIKHDGGPMPVPGDTVVATRHYRGDDPKGWEYPRDSDDGKELYSADFWHGSWKSITEYAIVTPSPSAADSERSEQSHSENADTTNPAHYKTGDVECIDAIRAQLTPEQFKGYLKASLVKYVWRYEHKGAALADLEKGKWFLERLIGEVRDGSD